MRRNVLKGISFSDDCTHVGYGTNFDTQNMEQPLIMIIKAVCVFPLAHFAFNHYDYNLDNMCVSMSALFSVIMTKPNIFSNFAPGVLIRRGVSAFIWSNILGSREVGGTRSPIRCLH